MPKSCSVCNHERRVEIDFALLQGEKTRLVSERFGLTYPAVKAHRRSAHHVVQTPRQGSTGPHTADTLLKRIEACLDDHDALADLRVAASALPHGERRRLVEALRSLAGRGEGGASIRGLARKYLLSEDSISRHRKNHLPRFKVEAATETREFGHHQKLKLLERTLFSVLRRRFKDEDDGMVLRAHGQLLRHYAFELQLGEIEEIRREIEELREQMREREETR